MIYNAKQLANQLKLIRTRNNITQAQLADRVGIKQATLSSFENKPETTQLQTLFKILHALEVDLFIQEKKDLPAKELTDEDW